ncbi:MAG: hypothetical protein ABH851_00050 [Methanobacteriota archaeon]
MVSIRKNDLYVAGIILLLCLSYGANKFISHDKKVEAFTSQYDKVQVGWGKIFNLALNLSQVEDDRLKSTSHSQQYNLTLFSLKLYDEVGLVFNGMRPEMEEMWHLGAALSGEEQVKAADVVTLQRDYYNAYGNLIIEEVRLRKKLKEYLEINGSSGPIELGSANLQKVYDEVSGFRNRPIVSYAEFKAVAEENRFNPFAW